LLKDFCLPDYKVIVILIIRSHGGVGHRVGYNVIFKWGLLDEKTD